MLPRGWQATATTHMETGYSMCATLRSSGEKKSTHKIGFAINIRLSESSQWIRVFYLALSYSENHSILRWSVYGDWCKGNWNLLWCHASSFPDCSKVGFFCSYFVVLKTHKMQRFHLLKTWPKREIPCEFCSCTTCTAQQQQHRLLILRFLQSFPKRTLLN